MELCQEFLIEQIFTCCKRPIHKRYQNVYNAECPICKEGKSSGRSRRLFYFPDKRYFFCHNCSKSWNPIEWVKEVSGLTFAEIIKENDKKSNDQTITKKPFQVVVKSQLVADLPNLPEGSVDLEDDSQRRFYSSDNNFTKALKYCEDRRLFTSVNRCKKFFVSLDDKIHKNRLVIPFYDSQEKIVCYQTRALNQDQQPKYLTKFGDKTIFNINNVNYEIPYIFVFEGPIDSMFVQNGVAMASLSPTERQVDELNSLFGYEKIYVFDNDKSNKQTSKKIEKHIKSGKTIFVWPQEFSKFKDINEICCELRLNEFPWKFIVKHSAKNESAMLKQKLLSC